MSEPRTEAGRRVLARGSNNAVGDGWIDRFRAEIIAIEDETEANARADEADNCVRHSAEAVAEALRDANRVSGINVDLLGALIGSTMKVDRSEFGRYTETMRTLARLYDVVVAPVLSKRRSEAAKRGWETRRQNQRDRHEQLED